MNGGGGGSGGLFGICIYLCFVFYSCAAFTGELFPFQLPNDCKTHEYYAVNTLTCKNCAKDKFLVPTEDSTCFLI